MEQEQQAGLLQGVRVLDLTRVLAGPFASMILADFGAEVVKVELPVGGDEARGFGPFVNGESAYFASVNRGKKSVAVDLRNERGQELARALAGRCHLLLENFRPGSMARFGLDYESLHAEHPRLVYASISGFGQTGPYAGRPAYDVIIQAMSGIASITGIEGQPPVRVGSSIADLSAALYGVIGMVAALARARETGMGQHLDVSMLDCQIALLENAVARYDVTGEVPAPLGSRHPAITPFQFFRAADGYLVIAAGNNRLWRSLCETVGTPELCEDQRFATNELRTRNHAEMEKLLAAPLARRPVEEWCDLLGQAGVPCGPIHDIGEVVADPHVAARGAIRRQEVPAARSSIAVPASPLRFSQAGCVLEPRPAPDLGQHTDEILGELAGVSRDELDRLRSEGVIG
ncbi:MAG: CaiB/BaiF CoA-transferase family protein [Gemmatimonadetes bacterium]|nr:CaiB/BaiF CoA-transferase family protein [Gemmatimonadota bacterium]